LKTLYIKSRKIIFKISIFFLVLFSGFSGLAQDNPPVQDSTKMGFSVGQLGLNNPPSVVNLYVYDPKTDRYIFTSTIAGYSINYPKFLTPKEYEAMVLKESIRNYYKKKLDAIDGVKKGSEEAKKDLLPKYYVNNSFFETIFGGNTIDVKPTGSVEMDLGVRYTKQDNPSFSTQNASNTTFDFNQRISMSLMGKVGTRLNVNANYDTQSTFAFQNLIKLEYNPDYKANEDDIIQKIEVGNVSMPLNTSLIRGAQSLFGVKAQLQFGKTTVTGVFSEQRSQTKSVTSQGGGTVQEFELFALDYDADRHFFLSQYFRNKYDESLKNYPYINSRVQITRVEAWITNRQNRVTTTNNNLRNIIALQDLGEAPITGFNNNEIVVANPSTGFFIAPPNSPADNKNNKYDPALIDNGGRLNGNIREIVTASSGFNGVTVSEGQDYSKLENARKLTTSEFTFHPQLGYISLQQKLANDEVLAVAFQYTIGDVVYQVGEFGTDGVQATETGGTTPGSTQPVSVSTQSLLLKMLKSNLTSVENPTTRVTTPIWNLMMKNIYQIPGAFQLQQTDFRFNILYTDPSPLNYINLVSPLPQPQDLVTSTPLLKVFNVDKLNFNNDPQTGGDGFFDFIPGLTVDTQNGRIIFTTVEPFGKHLFEKLRNNNIEDYNVGNYNANQTKYVYRNMYRQTQATALQDSEKNKFQLRGKFKSTGGDGISIGAFNVPRGSVVVTAGGRLLVEGVDYSVNYQLGRVQILDPSLQASNAEIKVSLENNAVFGQQTRRFMGFNVEHKISEKFMVGGTFLKMSEKPFTQKSSYGQESVNNTIFGFNTNFSTEVPFFTRLVNKLPNVDTDVPSNLSFRGEVAFLKPDTPDGDKFQGESTIYVDDFEGSQTSIDMRSPFSWSLSSTPEKSIRSSYDFNATATDLSYGYKRAKLSWYSIDPTFYVSRPSGVSIQDISINATRRIYSEELYPVTDIAIGQTQVVNTLDLAYYPKERGAYNYNPAAAATNLLPNPQSNFGGIMRSLSSTNFEQSNVEYLQFWLLDPYYDPGNSSSEASASNTGKIYFNLGSISEDVLKDGRKQFENGLGADQVLVSPQPIWGNIPASQSLIYAFDTNPANRSSQDIGLDGLNNSEEASKFTNFSGYSDPSADDYEYYFTAEGDVVDRYKNYNGTQGNSPVEVTDASRGSTTLPDVEDINRDNTMNTINAYFEYSIDLHRNMTIGVDRYVTDIRETDASNLPSGANPTRARWIQFKIPISQPENTIGGISDFRSISYMRMFMTGFNDKMIVRFGALDLVRGEWRRYTNTLDAADTDPSDDNTDLDVLTVNIQENGNRSPIRYVSPPGVVREQLFNNNSVINQNEQSLAMRVGGDGLQPGDSRAVFKNVSVDMRQFNKLKMFLHAEALPSPSDPTPLQNDQMIGFIRFGNDFTQNFYQVEIPLKVTPEGASSPEEVWPELNEINLPLDLLTQLKVLSLGGNAPAEDINGIRFIDDDVLDPSLATNTNRGKLRLGIRGNPNFGLVRTLMVGVKNKATNDSAIRGEVWFNELRLAEMDNEGGMAAVVSLDTNLADLATISASSKKSTVGFGALEQGPNERSREDLFQYNIVTNLSIGKLLPKKWGINLPFNYAVGEETITPEYDPFNQDIRLQQLLDVTSNQAERDNIRNRAIDYTKRRSINFIGVKKERGEKQKPHIYDPENLTLSYSYNEVERHNFEIESFEDKQVNTTVDYAYTFQPKPFEPFKKTKIFKKSDYWKLLSDFNFNYLPSNISFSTNIIRQYNRQEFRQVEVAGIGLDPLYRRNFLFNYQYGFNYNLTKALKFNFTASSNNIVRNYINDNNIPDNTVTIWDNYLDVGDPNQHTQQLTMNYELPINKIPLFSFIKSTYSYTGNYSWLKSSQALTSIEATDGTLYNLGNTIQNSAAQKLNTSFNMESFYRYIGLVKTAKRPVQQTPKKTPVPGQKVINNQQQQNVSDDNLFITGLRGVLTSVKNVQINYTENKGTALPGYLPGLGFLGTSKPTLGFVFGAQDDVRFEAAKNGWLTSYPEFNQNFTQVTNKALNITANIDLFPDFKIDLTADRTYADNFSEQYDVSGGQYNSRSPYYTGNFAISTIMIKTAFRNSDINQSSAFDDFRGNRIIIANRLAEQYYNSTTFPRDAEGYPAGFGKNSQSVLLPSFLAAYTGAIGDKIGESAKGVSLSAFRDFPIPNWTAKYSGLMRYEFFKENFKRFSIQHSYRSSYTINSFRSNLDYNLNPNGVDKGGNFFNKTIIGNVNLVEQFNPLVRLDFELKNSMKFLAEMKKDRALSMSFDNNLLTEVSGVEFVVGMGYRFKDVAISSKFADNAQGVLKGDINIKADFSYRNNQTIVRYLDYDNNQLAGGQNLWSTRITADYSLSKNLTTIFYYDHTFSKAVVSTSFPMTNIRAGFTLRYNFGN
jgi:cell surface protein SprA